MIICEISNEYIGVEQPKINITYADYHFPRCSYDQEKSPIRYGPGLDESPKAWFSSFILFNCRYHSKNDGIDRTKTKHSAR